MKKAAWIPLAAIGGLALFGFLVVYEVHFLKVVGDMDEMQSSMSKLEGNRPKSGEVSRNRRSGG